MKTAFFQEYKQTKLKFSSLHILIYSKVPRYVDFLPPLKAVSENTVVKPWFTDWQRWPEWIELKNTKFLSELILSSSSCIFWKGSKNRFHVWDAPQWTAGTALSLCHAHKVGMKCLGSLDVPSTWSVCSVRSERRAAVCSLRSHIRLAATRLFLFQHSAGLK